MELEEYFCPCCGRKRLLLDRDRKAPCAECNVALYTAALLDAIRVP